MSSCTPACQVSAAPARAEGRITRARKRWPHHAISSEEQERDHRDHKTSSDCRVHPCTFIALARRIARGGRGGPDRDTNAVHAHRTRRDQQQQENLQAHPHAVVTVVIAAAARRSPPRHIFDPHFLGRGARCLRICNMPREGDKLTTKGGLLEESGGGGGEEEQPRESGFRAHGFSPHGRTGRVRSAPLPLRHMRGWSRSFRSPPSSSRQPRSSSS